MSPGRMELRHELRQMLAPEMLQLLKLLQLPTLELQQLVRQELELNPLLDELPEGTDDEAGLAEPDGQPDQEPSEFEKIDWRDYLQEEWDAGDHQRESTPEVASFPIIESRASFQEYLLSQLRMASDDPEAYRAGEQIIGNLDADGFLAVPLEEIGRQLGRDTADLEAVLKLVQSLDPPGVAARDIREALLIQLKRQGREGTLAWRIVADHFKALEHQRYQPIARALRTTVAEVLKAKEVIAGLSPRPGGSFESEESRYVYPDMIIEKVDSGYQSYTNDRAIPRVRLAPGYKQILTQARKSSPQDREYVVKKLESARFIIRMIEQRRRTIKRILDAIIDRQRSFLDRGIRYLQPMTMGQVARDIGMHESTISRAVQNKYVLTPHGLMPLRYLFGGGLRTEAGMDSAKSIKAKIVEMVSAEESRSPLTDSDVAEALAKSGVSIARRTVAKYREEEKILPARMRRKG